MLLTWNMVYIIQPSGRLLENSATLKILRPHLFRLSNSWNIQRKVETLQVDEVTPTGGQIIKFEVCPL